MVVATRVKLYPNEEQKVLPEKRFGSGGSSITTSLRRAISTTLTKGAEKSYLNYRYCRYVDRSEEEISVAVRGKLTIPS
ncbi:MAG: hypothetical protein ACP5T2_06965, partial [Thermoprotei archaeon]